MESMNKGNCDTIFVLVVQLIRMSFVVVVKQVKYKDNQSNFRQFLEHFFGFGVHFLLDLLFGIEVDQ